MNAKEKYIAIKINHLNHWLWFETEKISDDGDTFKGWDGWGCIRCNTTEIGLFTSQVNWPMHVAGPAPVLALCDSCKRQIEGIKNITA